MKIIFSRKGYDSANGGVPSPIFPDGTFCSLPIPADEEPRLGALRFGEFDLGQIIEQLTKRAGIGKSGVHLDPDLNKDAVPRKEGWLPCFGQVDAAQSHLNKQHVEVDDLFLFFGWFREVTRLNGILSYLNGANDIHCLFGWLQIGKIYHPGAAENEPPSWAADHPHVKYKDNYSVKTNTLYVAAERLQIPGLKLRISGGGIFRKFTKCLCLTESGQNRSVWRLPLGFYPEKGAAPLSYHSDMKRWSKDKNGVLLKTVPIGQEFVLDIDHYPAVETWLREIFESSQVVSGARS